MPAAGAVGFHRDIVPVSRQIGLGLVGVVDDFTAENMRAADVGAHEGAARTRSAGHVER